MDIFLFLLAVVLAGARVSSGPVWEEGEREGSEREVRRREGYWSIVAYT